MNKNAIVPTCFMKKFVIANALMNASMDLLSTTNLALAIASKKNVLILLFGTKNLAIVRVVNH
jgi:hypothetical protein